MKPMRWLAVCCLCAWLSVLSPLARAQSMDRVQIESQKLQLQKERDDIGNAYAAQAKQCWQRFWVNDCLNAARLQRRQALSPIDKQEQALRAAQRDLMVIEREERLNQKQPETPERHEAKP